MMEIWGERIDLDIKKYHKAIDILQFLNIINNIRDYTQGFSRSTIISVAFS